MVIRPGSPERRRQRAQADADLPASSIAGEGCARRVGRGSQPDDVQRLRRVPVPEKRPSVAALAAFGPGSVLFSAFFAFSV